MFFSGDGVSAGLALELMSDLKKIREAPKDVSRCVEKTQ
jgi:hypothetical protein